MKKQVQLSTALLVLFIAATAFAGVTVSSPSNGATVGTSVNFVASSTSSCSKGVAAMGIYPSANWLVYTVPGNQMNTTVKLNPGTYNAVVEEWDNCGGAATAPITITVNSGGKTLYNIQRAGGWQSYGQQPPNFVDCTSCSGLTWAMYQNISSPSLSGSSTQYKIGGTTPYSDVLFLNHLIGTFSSQNLPDTSQTIVPALHDFTYDVYFWGSNLGAAEGLEFDVNQFFNGMGFTFGHECMVAWRQEWDVWDAANFKWVPTGIPCKPINNAWNHLILQVSRTSSDQMYYKSITLNGVTYNVNRTYGHFSAPGWYGITVNYQMDGDYKQTPYAVYVDKLNLTYQ